MRSDGGDKTPLVSIIMNCRNGEQFLKEAIDSVLGQTYANWEIIFWDNLSSDNSAKIFQGYKDERFRYYLADEYSTLGCARNYALLCAKGEFIAFLDCDDVWLPQKLERQIPLFDNSSTGIVICDTYFFNSKKIIRQLYKRKKPPVGKVFPQLLCSYFISLETAVIRSEVLKNMDEWFDQRFQVIEEYDFFLRIGHHWAVDYVDEVLAKWRVHESSWTWRRPELFPLETRMLLEKLDSQIPNFLIEFKEERKKVLNKVSLREIIIAWSKGSPYDSFYKFKISNEMNFVLALAILVTILMPFRLFQVLYKYRVGLTF